MWKTLGSPFQKTKLISDENSIFADFFTKSLALLRERIPVTTRSDPSIEVLPSYYYSLLISMSKREFSLDVQAHA